MKTVKMIVIAGLMLVSAIATAQTSFCEGFEEGYREVAEYCTGLRQVTPVCPIQPIKRRNISDYKHGYLIGSAMANDKFCD